jgi:hypothetical protein
VMPKAPVVQVSGSSASVSSSSASESSQPRMVNDLEPQLNKAMHNIQDAIISQNLKNYDTVLRPQVLRIREQILQIPPGNEALELVTTFNKKLEEVSNLIGKNISGFVTNIDPFTPTELKSFYKLKILESQIANHVKNLKDFIDQKYPYIVLQSRWNTTHEDLTKIQNNVSNEKLIPAHDERLRQKIGAALKEVEDLEPQQMQ